jgi:hypothetical protein
MNLPRQARTKHLRRRALPLLIAALMHCPVHGPDARADDVVRPAQEKLRIGRRNRLGKLWGTVRYMPRSSHMTTSTETRHSSRPSRRSSRRRRRTNSPRPSRRCSLRSATRLGTFCLPRPVPSPHPGRVSRSGAGPTASSWSCGSPITSTSIVVSFSGHDVRHADGRQLQRVGLVPHIEVRPTIKGIREGRDEVLERARKFLLETDAEVGKKKAA